QTARQNSLNSSASHTTKRAQARRKRTESSKGTVFNLAAGPTNYDRQQHSGSDTRRTPWSDSIPAEGPDVQFGKNRGRHLASSNARLNQACSLQSGRSTHRERNKRRWEPGSWPGELSGPRTLELWISLSRLRRTA